MRSGESTLAARPRGDVWLDVLVFALTLIGLVYLYSATYLPPDSESGRGWLFGMSSNFLLQLLWVGMGVFVYRLISRADFTSPPVHWIAIYAPIVVLLVIVILFGKSAGGAQRWIDIGIRLQPSEYAKIAFILAVSQIFSRRGGINSDRFWGALSLLAFTMVLIVYQPDLGTALVFVAVFSVLLWVIRGGKRFLAAFVVVLLLMAVPGWLFLKDYQKDRLINFLNPQSDLQGSGYNVHQSKIAIGSGGLFGEGLRQGTQTQGDFVPNDHTDFIFSVVGEEGGFVVGTAVLILFMLLILRLTWVGEIAANEYQRMIAFGVSAMLFFQVMVNVSMNMGILPVTGLPLPFFSYGGNSLFTTFLALGICQSIVRNRYRVSLKSGTEP